MKKVLFISSTGGHLNELLSLSPLFRKYDYYIITEKDKTNEYLEDKYEGRVSYLPYGTRSHIIRYIFIYFYLILKTIVLYFKIRPKVIVTTGTHTAGPMCYLGKIFGSKIIYIETFANINKKTATRKVGLPNSRFIYSTMGRNVKTLPKSRIWWANILRLEENMILVLLGTQNNQFKRLLEEIENAIDSGIIKERVVVQAGFTKYKTDKMNIFDMKSKEVIDNLVDEASVIITHGGVGSIILGLKKNKKVIALPRLHEYGEHVNNHQRQIIDIFSKQGYIIGLQNVEDLPESLKEINEFTPKRYQNDNKKMLEIIDNFIENVN